MPEHISKREVETPHTAKLAPRVQNQTLHRKVKSNVAQGTAQSLQNSQTQLLGNRCRVRLAKSDQVTVGVW